MRGHVRHRGDERAGSWEYIVDVGLHAAQRCPACKKRFWVERRPAKACPKCGGELTETEERRRETKSGFATQKECEAAMNKLLVKVEEQVYTPPTKASRAGVPDQGVAAGREGDDPPHDLPLLRAARDVPHRAAHRVREAGEAHGQPGEPPLREARRDRQEGWQDGPLCPDHPPRPHLPAQGLQGRGQVGAAAEEPGRRRRPAEHAGRGEEGDEDLERQAARRRSSSRRRATASRRSGGCSP